MSDRETRFLDWRRLLPAAGTTTIRLRQFLLSGALASAGLVATGKTAQAAEVPRESPLPLAPAITERGKRTARLVLALPGIARNLLGQHRSHSSHSSHRSHSSHYSGSRGGSSTGSVAPVVPAAPAPRPETPTASSASALTAAPELEPNTVVGVVEKIDRAKRLLSIKTSTGTRDLAFRDDTQFEIVAGVAVRLDEYLEAHPNSFPVAEKERVRIKWRTNTTTSGQVATQVSPAKP